MISHEDAMILAYRHAMESPDPSTQNGAVLLAADPVSYDRAGGWDYKIIGAGCNDFPRGVDLEHWTGPKEGKYARVVHSEVSAILDAARSGHATEGATLVCPWAACSNCSKHIAAAGIAVLVRHPFFDNGVASGNSWYDDCVLGDEIMKQAGIVIVEIDPLIAGTGIQLRREGRLWPEAWA